MTETATFVEKLVNEVCNLIGDRQYSKESLANHPYFSWVQRLLPKNPRGAPIEFSIVNNEYFRLFIGKATEISFDLRKENPDEVREEVNQICRAVVDGKVSETLWLFKDKVTRYYSQIVLNGRVVESRDCNLFAYIFLRPKKQLLQYTPW